MGRLTPMQHPYLFGGGISGVLIAGAVFAFVSMVAVISQTELPGNTLVSTPPHGNLTLGASQGIVGEDAGGNPVTAPVMARAFARVPSAVSGSPTAANGRTAGSREAPVDSSGATGRTNGGAGGGPTPGNPGQGGQPPGPGEGPSSPGPDQPGPTAGPPGLAKKPGGLPPGLAKKPGGRPPGLSKEPGGQPSGAAKEPGGPPGLAKKPSGLPPGHARG
jgi:hypothetical protein